MRNIKDQYLEITTLAKIWGPLCKKNRLKTDYSKVQGLSYNLVFSDISWNCFYIGKVMGRVYGSRDHGWLSVHGGLATMGRRGCSGTQEVIVIAWRERERERERER
jgi:hypothetical protein